MFQIVTKRSQTINVHANESGIGPFLDEFAQTGFFDSVIEDSDFEIRDPLFGFFFFYRIREIGRNNLVANIVAKRIAVSDFKRGHDLFAFCLFGFCPFDRSIFLFFIYGQGIIKSKRNELSDSSHTIGSLRVGRTDDGIGGADQSPTSPHQKRTIAL
jgi:hypothetical protein